MTFTPDHHRLILDLVRQSIQRELSNNPPLRPPLCDLPPLNQHVGCFVTLHRCADHALRGCMGQVFSTQPLLWTIQAMALEVLHDPRFRKNPVTLRELAELELEVTILSPLKLAAHHLDFNPLHDGLYLQIDGRTGCFLPQVARSTGWSRQQLLTRLCTEKMGLPPQSLAIPRRHSANLHHPPHRPMPRGHRE